MDRPTYQNVFNVCLGIHRMWMLLMLCSSYNRNSLNVLEIADEMNCHVRFNFRHCCVDVTSNFNIQAAYCYKCGCEYMYVYVCDCTVLAYLFGCC